MRSRLWKGKQMHTNATHSFSDQAPSWWLSKLLLLQRDSRSTDQHLECQVLCWMIRVRTLDQRISPKQGELSGLLASSTGRNVFVPALRRGFAFFSCQVFLAETIHWTIICCTWKFPQLTLLSCPAVHSYDILKRKATMNVQVWWSS